MTDQPFTKTPNAIYDAIPDMTLAEVRCTMALVRRTYGYHKDSVQATYDDIQKWTGLSRQGVSDGMMRVRRRGFFAEGDGRSTWAIVYKSDRGSLNGRPKQSTEQTETVYEVDQDSLKSRPEQSTNQTENSLKSRPHHLYKEKERKTKRDHVPIAGSQTQEIVFFLVNEVGLTPPHDTDRDRWEEWAHDIDILLRIGDDDTEQTKKHIWRVKDYMDTAEPEPLTYTRPRSFISIARRLKNQPERERVSASEKQARDKADEIYDWLIQQGKDIGRNLFPEWGVPEDVKNILIDELGSDCVQKLTGRNPEDYRQDFIDGYVKHQTATAAQ